ncbi:anion permease [Coxiella burnetii]|nr:sulfite exporter TauE/SafE family protein [Coxiella burnetii]OYK79666.1 anion permease [Coxiella burnetii]OYK81751.1 anion permease [Coxiella burnetii]
MLNLLILCSIAGGLGALLQGMVGIGTSIILIPLLTLLLPHYGIPSNVAIHTALATTMAAVVVSSTSALVKHHKHGNIQWPLFKKIIGFSVGGAFAGALIASFIPGRYLEYVFGIFMLLLAPYMLFKKPSNNQTKIESRLRLPILATGGLGIGFMASLLGAGGSVFMIPFLNALKINMRYAVGTSTLIGLPVATIGTITYIFTGLAQMPHSSFTIGYLNWPIFLAISFAGILCAPFGAKLTAILPTKILQRSFAIGMAIIGIKMVI